MVQINEKESDIQKTILEWLTWKKVFHYRNNSGASPRESNGKRYYIRFGERGSPDIICVIDGKYVGIECKTSKGKQSESQIEFQKRLEDAGGVYFLARSLEDVIDFFKKV